MYSAQSSINLSLFKEGRKQHRRRKLRETREQLGRTTGKEDRDSVCVSNCGRPFADVTNT